MTTGRNGDAGSFDDDSMEDMESLLSGENLEYRSLRRGDVVEGIVMEMGREGVLVDINSKSEGIVPLSEMHSLGADPLTKIKRGDELLLYILQPESNEGQVLLSLDRARGEQGWRTLQKRFEDGESFEGEVTGFNKGGLLVNVEGVNAFVPLSQVVGVRPDREEGGDAGLQATVGRNLRLKVIEINRRRNRVILSERAAMQEYRSVQKDRLLAELREGEVRRGRITSVRDFGVFVDLGGADGLAHLSELTWERGKSPGDVYRVGDEVDAYVMKVDPETKKIALSLRRAQPERWDQIVDAYRPGQVVAGRVTKLVTFGAFARIDGPVEGLIHVSELSDRRIQHPRDVVEEGDIVPLKIVRIERDKHRIGLSLRAARDEAENLGWEFNDDGSVRSFPDYLRPEIEARLGGAPPARAEAAAPAATESAEPAAPREERAARESTEDRRAPARGSAPAAVERREEPDYDEGGSFAALRGFRVASEEEPAEELATAEESVAAPVAGEEAAETATASVEVEEADEAPSVEVDVAEEVVDQLAVSEEADDASPASEESTEQPAAREADARPPDEEEPPARRERSGDVESSDDDQ